MKTKQLMKDHPTLKIIIAYENFAAAIRAKELTDRLAAELESQDDMDCDFWKFDLLERPQFLAQATADVAEADIIVISVRGAAALPAATRTWLANWPAQRRERLTALIVLREKPGAVPEGNLCNDLRRIARSRRMDFFCEKWTLGGLNGGHGGARDCRSRRRPIKEIETALEPRTV